MQWIKREPRVVVPEPEPQPWCTVQQAREILGQGYTLEHTAWYTGWPAEALMRTRKKPVRERTRERVKERTREHTRTRIKSE